MEEIRRETIPKATAVENRLTKMLAVIEKCKDESRQQAISKQLKDLKEMFCSVGFGTDLDMVVDHISQTTAAIANRQWVLTHTIHANQLIKKVQSIKSDAAYLQTSVQRLHSYKIILTAFLEYLDAGEMPSNLPDLATLKLNDVRTRSVSFSTNDLTEYNPHRPHSKSTNPSGGKMLAERALENKKSGGSRGKAFTPPPMKRRGSLSNFFSGSPSTPRPVRSQAPNYITQWVKRSTKVGFVGHKWRRQWVILNSHQLEFFKEEKATEPTEVVPLAEVNVLVIDKSTKNPNEFVCTLRSDDKERASLMFDAANEMHQFCLALSGLRAQSLVPCLQHEDRVSLLASQYFNDHKGGIIKSSYQEEWCYYPNGDLKCLEFANEEEKQDIELTYKWDGRTLAPDATCMMLGQGEWDGVSLLWKTIIPGQAPSVLQSFTYFPNGRYYQTGDDTSTQWQWTRHFLAKKHGSGEWIVEGQVPEPVVMFLQVLRSVRGLSNDTS